MNVLMGHNYYQQPGGEDIVFEAETALLRAKGHRVETVAVHNDDLKTRSTFELTQRLFWNPAVLEDLTERASTTTFDVAHFHNTFPLLSASAQRAMKRADVPVVQTLHNYRFLCPKGTFYRNGGVCEDCLGRAFAVPGILRSCYKNSPLHTTGVATFAGAQRLGEALSPWVDRYIALTEFARAKFIEGGLPEDKLVVKPNFLEPDPGLGHHEGDFALYSGRLAEEKGIDTLLEAWRYGPDLPLKIVGDGPLRCLVEAEAKRNSRIEWLGFLPRDEVLDLMRAARLLLIPSRWYEGFPMTLLEAMAVGLPTVASNIGSLSSLVEDSVTGLHARPGDAEDVAEKARWVLEHPTEAMRLAATARHRFEAHYTAEANYQQLIDIYHNTG